MKDGEKLILFVDDMPIASASISTLNIPKAVSPVWEQRIKGAKIWHIKTQRFDSANEYKTRMEYYYHRSNKYYFRNNNSKLIIELVDDFKFKKGVDYEVEFTIGL